MNNNTIYVPTLKIEEAIAPLIAEIDSHYAKAESLSIFNTFMTYSELSIIRVSKMKLQNKYDEKINDCYTLMATPCEAPGALLGGMQAWSLSKGLSSAVRLQTSWGELSALIDRKYTYTTAVFSIYLAIFSIILTLALAK